MGTIKGVPRPTSNAQKLRNAATPAESKLWSAINASKLGWKFSRQMPVGPYICDFLSRSAMLAIEIDGYSHDFTVDADAVREAFLRSRGLAVLRFSNAEVMSNLDGVVFAISEMLVALPTPIPSRRREGGEER
ncbi:MAG: DUF559 domain-containing protein [Pseudomonadota bacterium]|nr:DUF559 domain-containing protein [Pseudomonadota bacterium]